MAFESINEKHDKIMIRTTTIKRNQITTMVYSKDKLSKQLSRRIKISYWE